MNKLKRNILSFGMMLCLLNLSAQGPNNSGTYYQKADGKKGQALKTALAGVIRPHKTVSYDGLLSCYQTTDRRADGKLWDMYSDMTNFVIGGDKENAQYKKEGDGYNREHSVPKSWFSEATPMKSDLVHVVPTDGYVNNRRGNYPFGENNGEKWSSHNNFSKLGNSTTPGYSGICFEPNDEYKGDFARIYFYMVTCYEDNISSWNSEMLAHNKYPAFTKWALDMLLRWAEQDPVSQKEIDRNNEVYKYQNNRNPYVDYPGLEQLVWGAKQDVAFDYDNNSGTVPDPDPDPDPNPGEDPDPIIPEGQKLFKKITSEKELTDGCGYIIVCEQANIAMAGSGKDIRTNVGVSISGNNITTEVNASDRPYMFIIGGNKDAYTLYDTNENIYLSLTSDGNKLYSSTSVTSDNEKWAISFSGGDAVIKSNAYPERAIYYNVGSPRFACYKASSNQTAIQLYKEDTSTGIGGITADTAENVDVYTVTGQKIRSDVNRVNAVSGLPAGIYIINGKKLLVK